VKAELVVSHHWGYVSAIASAVLFGISSTFNKIALEDVHPIVVAGMIYFLLAEYSYLEFMSRLSAREFSPYLRLKKLKPKYQEEISEFLLSSFFAVQ